MLDWLYRAAIRVATWLTRKHSPDTSPEARYDHGSINADKIRAGENT